MCRRKGTQTKLVSDKRLMGRRRHNISRSLSLSISVCLYVSPSINLLLWLSLCMHVPLFVSLSLYFSLFLPLCLSPFASLSVYLFLALSIFHLCLLLCHIYFSTPPTDYSSLFLTPSLSPPVSFFLF